jgi:hypothetical protein
MYMDETGTAGLVERVELDIMARENRTPEMLALNPLGETSHGHH